MSERKVLNKYYPPDFDPSKIPRAKCPKNRQFTVRLMAPCNMKCLTCGEYIAKAKKFNARKEDVENLSYHGIRIYRFYIKCPGCLAEISFRTDPETTDYVIEAGAHRNFQALKLAEEQAAREEREMKEEIESNPMLLLENRTQQSQYEMEVLESLEDLRELNERHAGINIDSITNKYDEFRRLTNEQIDAAETIIAKKALGFEMIDGKFVKRIHLNDAEDELPTKKKKFTPLAKIDTQNSFKNKIRDSIKIKKKLDDKPDETNKSEHIEKGKTESQAENALKLDKEYKTEVNGSKITGLSLLGSYSDSEDSNSED